MLKYKYLCIDFQHSILHLDVSNNRTMAKDKAAGNIEVKETGTAIGKAIARPQAIQQAS